MKKTSKRSAFTLIELLIVIAVIGILAAMLFPAIQSVMGSAQGTQVANNGKQIVTKEQLLLKVWGYDSEAEDNNVEVYISFLRKKLAFLKAPVQIATLRKFGYRLEAVEK